MPTTQPNNPTPLDACNPSLNATVSASAGSGKTWLLITRIVRLLIDGAEPGNIIALTFTRKAAGEMQIRLNQRLFEMATAEDDELDSLLQLIGCNSDEQSRVAARGLYEKLMHSLYPIRIQTFHSFCQDILSRFPLEADIPPGFDLIEDSSLLERQAWQALFEQAALPSKKNSTNRVDNALTRELDIIMLACNGPDNTRTALHSFLSHRSDWWAYTAHTQNPVDFAAQQLTQSLQLNEQDNSANNNPVEQFLSEDTKNKLTVFANLLREVKTKTSDKHAAVIDNALDNVLDNSAEIDTVFALIRSAFIKKDGEVMVQGRKHTAALDKKLGTENADLFIELHETIAAAIQVVDETLKRRFTLQLNKAWYFAGQQYVEIFQQLKREMRLLDFTDLEWKCYQLLQHADNAHWVQYKIDQRIDHLLIDEFQDTNPTQWHLLSPILDEIAANPEERQRSVFLVGDEKQSIYSFRRANPALQARASDWLAEYLDAKATPLDFSRRSSSAIIHCVNQIFEQDAVKTIMAGYTTHGTHLDTLPGKVLLCDLFQRDEADDETIEAEQTPQPFRNPLKQPREISLKTLRHEEADYIARQILRLVDTPELITEDGTVRAVEFGDVMVLMRNRTHIHIYEEALKQHGIAFIGSKKGGLLDNLEIQDLNCLLNTLITPFNNLALAQVLKSPLFDASDEDLILLAQHSGRASAHWYERLLQLATETGPDKTSLSKALRRASTLLPRWQKMAEQLPVHDCLDRIFSEGNLINRYIAANRAENRHKIAANCQRFLELSLETDSGRYPSITRFLQNLGHLENYSANPPEEPLSQSNESRVRLMTIHGSKGLEAPVVFLADCNSTATNKNAYASLVRWPADESRPVNFQLQLSKDNTDNVTQKLQQEKLDEQAREELNLLYVALTRAREQLYISGIESRSRQDNSWYQIISNGLTDISEGETGIDEINGKVYTHLSYDRDSIDVSKNDEPSAEINTEPQLVIDERLLKPVTELPRTSFLIAPSLNTDETAFHKTSLSLSTDALDDGFDTDHNTDNSAAELAKWRGIIIHRMLEQLCDTGEYPATGRTADDLQQRLTAEVALHKPDFINHLDSCVQEAVATFNHPDFKAIFKPGSEAETYNEMPLMYKEETQAVYGIIDRVIKTADSVIIIDYKSHQLTDSDNAAIEAQQFSDQLAYYHRGIEKLWPGYTVKTGILFTRRKEIVWLKEKF